MRRRLWMAIAALVAVLVAALVGVTAVVLHADDTGGTPTSRPLTADEANRLGVTRFRNHEAGARHITVTIPGTTGGAGSGAPLTLTGSADFTRHLGYGVLTDEGTGAVSLVQWTLTSVIALPWSPGKAIPATPPADTAGWQGRSLVANGSSVDTALLLVLNLAGDRPENAQLLNQNGALWLRSTTLDGQKVDVVRGPGAEADGQVEDSRTRFWLTADGTSLRVEVDLATSADPLVVGLGDTVTPPRAVKGLLEHNAPEAGATAAG
jgi:hypothetical protein